MQGILHQRIALMAGGLHDDFIVETILAAARGGIGSDGINTWTRARFLMGHDVDEGSNLDLFLEAYVQVRLYGTVWVP
jgi:hypothetical protein